MAAYFKIVLKVMQEKLALRTLRIAQSGHTGQDDDTINDYEWG